MRKLIQLAVANPGWTLLAGIVLYYVVAYGSLRFFGMAPF